MSMLISEALKVLLEAKKGIEMELAIKKLSEKIADDECNQHRMTKEEWENIRDDYMQDFRRVFIKN